MAEMSTSERPEGLTAPQYRALIVLLTGGTNEAAAEAAAKSDGTIRRWRELAEFAEALRAGARSCFREADSLLLAAAQDSVQALWNVVRSGSEAAQIQAAKALLDLGHKVAVTISMSDCTVWRRRYAVPVTTNRTGSPT